MLLSTVNLTFDRKQIATVMLRVVSESESSTEKYFKSLPKVSVSKIKKNNVAACYIVYKFGCMADKESLILFCYLYYLFYKFYLYLAISQIYDNCPPPTSILKLIITSFLLLIESSNWFVVFRVCCKVSLAISSTFTITILWRAAISGYAISGYELYANSLLLNLLLSYLINFV